METVLGLANLVFIFMQNLVAPIMFNFTLGGSKKHSFSISKNSSGHLLSEIFLFCKYYVKIFLIRYFTVY